MPQINLLDQQTIDKIAAGEVIERPASVVKELVENAIDAKATAITVEIKEGGKTFMRITDNGCGIDREQVQLAFLRHSTSKITSVEDLLTVSSLGFRGEALSSIAAVAQVELITKTMDAVTGVRYTIEGSVESELEEIGAPDGTTFIVRNLFFNTPARQKFLKSAMTEAGYISTLMEHLALSHAEISFKFIVNGQIKLQTSGNGNKRDIIYNIYGKDIARNLIEVSYEHEGFSFEGFIGKPIISRGNRNYENYYINLRYVKSSIISKAIEEAYRSFMMQHQYPFTVLYFKIDGELIDVNVHPTKMELRFSNGEELYRRISEDLRQSLMHRELIPSVSADTARTKSNIPKVNEPARPEPFEKKRLSQFNSDVNIVNANNISKTNNVLSTNNALENNNVLNNSDILKIDSVSTDSISKDNSAAENNVNIQELVMQTKPPVYNRHMTVAEELLYNKPVIENNKADVNIPEVTMSDADTNKSKVVTNNMDVNKDSDIIVGEQTTLELDTGAKEGLLSKSSKKYHRIIGQYLDTYWLVEFDEKLYIIDQHAAHEKVLFERTMRTLRDKEYTSQNLCPPIILTLNMQEEELLKKYMPEFERIGFEITFFGGREYSVSAVPDNVFGINGQELIIDMLDGLSNISSSDTSELILEKVASMSCKAAVKGHDHLTREEIEELIDELLELENPYNCPHGRPTIISMSKYEIEKKFKRIV